MFYAHYSQHELQEMYLIHVIVLNQIGGVKYDETREDDSAKEGKYGFSYWPNGNKNLDDTPCQQCK